MAKLDRLFVTTIYRTALLGGAGGDALRDDIARSAKAIAAEDTAGQTWCRRHGYKGYTSYASLQDLPWRDPVFADLVKRLDGHVARFADALEYDLDGRALELDSLWINILEPGGRHTAHIHPNSVVSGTYYAALPKGAAGLKFEDPRLPLFMAAPPKKAKARLENQTFVTVEPRAGTLLLWESCLRHEVPLSGGQSDRISVSFNYALA